jgi:hypothetical protein
VAASDDILSQVQGDQIGRTFAYWAIVYNQQFFLKMTASQHFSADKGIYYTF